jgi:vacuolar protein sorting-associated protein 72
MTNIGTRSVNKMTKKNVCVVQSPHEEEDEVDSDFSIDENDEARSDQEQDGDEGQRRKIRRAAGVQTKAYKEPVRKTAAESQKSAHRVATNAVSASRPRPQKSAVARLASPEFYDARRRPTMRASTAQKTSEIIRTLKQRDAESKRRKLRLKKGRGGRGGEERRLTQAEILAEARLTERTNLESLKRYEEMELEAKRRAVRSGKREIRGPVIRYHSLRLPVV